MNGNYKMKVEYCQNCIISNLKPNNELDKNGICTACKNQIIKKSIINSTQKKILKSNFKKILKNNIKKNNKYDVVVAVSGGKDSIYQIVQLKKFTSKILAVCVDFGLRTEIGEHNLQLIQNKLNVDLIKFSLKKNIIKKLALYSLEKHGDPDLFNHPLIYNIPPIIAKNFGINIVVYGEDPRIEYSNTKLKNINTLINQKFDKNYFENFVSHSRIDLLNILRKLSIPLEDRSYFTYQSKLKSIKILFLGNFFIWDSINNYKIAKKIGFKENKTAEGTYRKFVNVDEDWNRVHHYLKMLKFGYGRCSDHAAEDIRKGYLKRNEAIKLVKKYDMQPLSKYYKKRISNYLNISETRLSFILEKFRNKLIWKKVNKKWVLKYPLN